MADGRRRVWRRRGERYANTCIEERGRWKCYDMGRPFFNQTDTVLSITLHSCSLTVNKSKMEQSIGSDCVVEIRDIPESRQSPIKSKILLLEKKNNEDAFFVIDLGEIVRKYANWVRKLPRVKPFYAIKCNDDYAVLKILADLGTGFDCASQVIANIQILNLDVDPGRIIYANTIKQTSFLKYSAGKNVTTMTFDNEAGLYKIKAVFPSARNTSRKKDGVKVIAKPGRYFVTSAFSLAANIIGKRVMSRHQKNEDSLPIDSSVESDDAAIMYYINDGMYGSFNSLYFDKAALIQCVLRDKHGKGIVHSSSLWGPTCAGVDCIVGKCQLPELSVGDWLCFSNMGAYSIVSGSTFNGMPRPRHFYNCQPDIWYVVHFGLDNTY
ncbi:hypothetical protein ScPMuIL_006265 [Solemya velum]